MVRDDVRVVELVGRVVARALGELGGSRDHVLGCPARSPSGGPRPTGSTSISAPSARISWKRSSVKQSAITISGAVALRPADERERGPGAAARVLDDRVAGRDQPVPLGALDHRERHPVLHRAGRVAVLELHPELGAVRRRAPAQPDERRVPDRVEDRAHAADDLTTAHGRSEVSGGRRGGSGCLLQRPPRLHPGAADGPGFRDRLPRRPLALAERAEELRGAGHAGRAPARAGRLEAASSSRSTIWRPRSPRVEAGWTQLQERRRDRSRRTADPARTSWPATSSSSSNWLSSHAGPRTNVYLPPGPGVWHVGRRAIRSFP